MKCENLKCKNDLSPLQEKGGQRFCCISCSNSGVPRISTIESRKKISDFCKNKAKEKLCICNTCGKQFIVFKTKKKIICSAECFKESKFIGAKRAAITRKKNGTDPGWPVRNFEPSYPEKYFIGLFEKENIRNWIRELKVGKWFIDFAFKDKMIAVEIDGAQHYTDSIRMKNDKIKDEFLKSVGWKIIRIKWFDPQNQIGKDKLYPQIDKLLETLNARLV